jgi:protein-tyrosine phosphatase
MRDLGGYPTVDGHYLTWGKIIRSDCPIKISDADTRKFEELKITDVIDLRTSEQASEEPSYFANLDKVTYHNISFMNGNGFPETEESIVSTYVDMMEEADTLRQIMNIVAESKGAVLYHCAVGKDRTGVVTAIILSICGVGVEDIIADYQISETYIYDFITELKNKYPEIPSWTGRSKPEYMRACLEGLIDRYGSITEYLKALKISDTTMLAIKEKMVGKVKDREEKTIM